jgi:hypothetical protein
MIKNIFLGLFFLGLVLFAYYWEEVGVKSQFIKNTNGEQIVLFDVNSVVSLTLKHAKIIKNDNEWTIGDLGYMANKGKVQFILKTLNGITKVKKIQTTDKEEKAFFVHQDHSFTVKTFNNEVTFRLGDISNVTGMFYLQKFQYGKKELFLCRDINVYDGLYKSDFEANYQKYIYLKDIITSNAMNLISPRLIFGLNSQKIKKIKIDNKTNRWFDVDFDKKITTPSKYKNLDYLSFAQTFDSLWNTIKVSKIINDPKLIISDELSTIEIKLKSEKVHLIKLYGLLNSENGYYAKVDNKDLIYVIDEKAKDFFFANVQDFWNKRISYGVDFRGMKKVDFQIGTRPDQMHDFYIDDIETFDIKSKSGSTLKVSNFNMLFNILLNLQSFKQAKYVTNKISKPKNHFTLLVNIFNRKLQVHFKKHMIIVSDLTSTIEYFYPHNNSMINIDKIEDFFTLN